MRALDQFIADNGGLARALLKARNMRFARLGQKSCALSTMPEAARLLWLDEGRACLNCPTCAAVLSVVLKKLVDNEAAFVDGDEGAGDSGNKALSTDKWGLPTFAWGKAKAKDKG